MNTVRWHPEKSVLKPEWIACLARGMAYPLSGFYSAKATCSCPPKNGIRANRKDGILNILEINAMANKVARLGGASSNLVIPTEKKH